MEKGAQAGRALHGDHAEPSGPPAELYGNNYACKLGVCCAAKAGEHGQRKDGGGHRGVRGAAAVRGQYRKRHGAYEMRGSGNTF